MIPLPQALDLAVKHHQAGRLQQAEQLYRQILQVHPRQVDALHLLGLIAFQVGSNDLAIDYMKQALHLRPNSAEVHNNLATALAEGGRLEEAATGYRQAVRLKPDYAEAHNNLGTTLAAQGKQEEAVASYRHALRLQPDYAEAQRNLGIALKEQGNLEAAIACYHQALRLKPDYAEAHTNLGVALVSQGRLQEAVSCYQQALRLKPNYVEAHNNLGVALAEQGKLPEAVAYYQGALRLKPDFAEALTNLGNALKRQERLEEAVASYQQALRFKPDYAAAHDGLGIALTAQGRLEEAVASLQQAVRLKADFAEAHHNLGIALMKQGRLEEAVASYRHALRLQPDFAEAHHNLGVALADGGRMEEALASYQAALHLKPECAEAHSNLAKAFREQGQLEEAEASFQQALRLKPSPGLRIQLATLLPPLYDSVSQVHSWRQRLADNLRRLRDDHVNHDLTSEPAMPLFYLAYQGMNDRDIQRAVAGLYGAPRVAADLTSRRTDFQSVRADTDGLKIGPTIPVCGGNSRKTHVAFLSRLFKRHTIGELFRGIIANLSRQEFSVTVLSLGRHRDKIAHFIRQHADQYIELPEHLQAVRRLIGELKLDVLFYPDIGMDPITYSLAFSRLAPVQCVTWGHPSTTGIETMDYFVSSELFEAPDAGSHYTETLVRLKNMPYYAYRPSPPEARLGRDYFGLTPDCHLYGCPQSLFKLHPAFDEVLGGILRADPRGLVILNQAHGAFYKHWEDLLRKRFAATIPDVAERIRFLPRLKHDDFVNLLLVTDVLLDPIHFNGGNTSLKALALGVPIVTLPLDLLKTRLTLGMYKKMNVLDCVVTTPEAYITTAVKLGSDPDYRSTVHRRIMAANGVLFENPEPVRELEQFFKLAVAHVQ